ncbi:tRNA pseudouridine(38/39) synthase [Bombus bifarius]|uniref:tRNA pseudouridine(38/39) synthase n=1 Tax=Bombus bifarius TaxID=103933 RepID=A0A6P8M6N3_9HYME|nr:tRNA pseudouridine(38/39) synthase [Bombus vancouverensis nearcticus]XP_033297097.1 tRNA pseudouridine(38/39) synthase [Bombus bifarius]
MSSMDKKKTQETLEKEELQLLSKAELIEKIIKLEEENKQLKAVRNKIKEKSKNKDIHKSQKPFDFSKCNKRHILLKFYYLGWNYNGYVVQESTDNTIEEHLFEALIKSCCIESRETSNYHRCGRTDKGVSSFSQVISIDLRSKLNPEDQCKLEDELPYCKILNRLLPSNIRCIAWCPASSNFSARFNCKFRTYKYFFPRGNLNIDSMDKAVKYTIGEHDFRNICKMDVANGVTNYQRKVIDAKVCLYRRDFRNISGYDVCQLIITSQAFLWHQIRCLMGVLFLIGQGNEKPEIILELLDIEKCPRKPQYNLAHEIPLNLWYCEYDTMEWYIDKDELINTIKFLQRDWTLNTVKSVMIENMLSDLEDTTDCKDMLFQSDCLLLGIQPRVYQRLMKRPTCESLESKIKHYESKKKKKEDPDNSDDK